MEKRQRAVVGWSASDLRDEALYTPEELRAMNATLAAKISAAYKDKSEELVLVGVLHGVFMFLADLSREISISHEIDFVSASSYGDATVSSGQLRITDDVKRSVAGKHVVLVDEICDTGHTLARLVALFNERDAASVKTCVLLDKVSCRAADVRLDFVGAVCPDEFVVGYGMDFAGKFRSLPFVGVMKPLKDN